MKTKLIKTTPSNKKSQKVSFFNKTNISPFIQPKLSISNPGDRAEKEADTIADQVVHKKRNNNSSKSDTPIDSGNFFIHSHPFFSQSNQNIYKKSFFPGILSENEIQRSGDDIHEETPDDTFTSELSNSRARGTPLDNPVRNDMEASFGRDFLSVNIHRSTEAERMNDSIGAKAFTYGTDIYFNKDQYNPSSQEGKHLLAHELVHTIQQTPSIKKATASPPPDKLETKDGKSTLRFNSGSKPALVINYLRLPYFKSRYKKKFKKPMKINLGARGKTKQRDNWISETTNDAKKYLDRKIKNAKSIGGFVGNTYYFQSKKNRKFFLIGEESDLLPKVIRPFWDDYGKAQSFQVDHIVECQLGGRDTTDNYELLESSANMSAGSKLAWEIRNKIVGSLNKLRRDNNNDSRIPNPNDSTYKDKGGLKRLKNRFSGIQFQSFGFDLGEISGNPKSYWKFTSIKHGKHLIQIIPLSGRKIRNLGKDDSPKIFTSKNGGDYLEVPKSKKKNEWIKRVDLKYWIPEENPVDGEFMGILEVDVYKAKDLKKKIVKSSYPGQIWNVIKMPNIYGGYIELSGKAQKCIKQSLNLPGMSPIKIDFFQLTGHRGFEGRGKLLPTLSIFKDADIDIIIKGDDIQLRKVFSLSEISLPPPFKLINTSLAIFYSTKNGIGIEGNSDFEITKVGQGHISASASQQGGFSLSGTFNFDSKLFNPASISVSYENELWSFEGTIGIPQGKIKGIKSAKATVSYIKKHFGITGKVFLDIPKVKNGELSISYNQTLGLVIGGSFFLSNDLPGIQKAKFEGQVAKKPGTDFYSISASGYLIPNIPGLKGVTITGFYKNGLFKIEGTKKYEIGIVSGNLTFGLTNAIIGTDGKPTDEPSDQLIFYGGALLSVTFAKILQATVNAKLTPEGTVKMAGEISIPKEVPLIDKKFAIKKDDLIKIPTVQIPIIGITVLGKGIGIFAEFGGGLGFEAGIGPLLLKNLSLNLNEFDPTQIENVIVTGSARLGVPLYAKLTLTLFGGIGLSLLIVDAYGRINGSASLILDAEAGGGVTVEWSKSTGLQLKEAFAEAQAAVKILLSLYASAAVELDLLFKTITLWSDKWDLTSKEIGTPLAFGVKFPVKLSNGQFNGIGFSDLTLNKPDFNKSDAKNLLTSGVEEAKNPPLPPPPDKKEVERRLRVLPAGQSLIGSRRGYAQLLKMAYPEIDFSYVPQILDQLDKEDLIRFKNRIQKLERGLSEFYILTSVVSFKKDHPGIDLSSLIPILKEKDYHSTAQYLT